MAEKALVVVVDCGLIAIESAPKVVDEKTVEVVVALVKVIPPVPAFNAKDEAPPVFPNETTALPVPAGVPAPILIVWVLPVAVLALPMLMVFEPVDWPKVIVPVEAVEPKVTVVKALPVKVVALDKFKVVLAIVAVPVEAPRFKVVAAPKAVTVVGVPKAVKVVAEVSKL